MKARRAVERIGPGDQVQLATDVGPVPMNVGAVLTLGGSPDPEVVVEALVTRVPKIARLRQRLVTPPLGLGRPYWLGLADVRSHVTQVCCPAPGDDDALLAVAVDAVTRPLPRSQPLWRAVVVSGLADGRLGVVIVLHHVLADGIGGLGVLAQLVDGGPAAPGGPPMADPGPRAIDLLADVASERWQAVRGVSDLGATLSRARTELGHRAGRGHGGAPRCSLNAPTGPRRRVATVDVELAPVREAGRRHGATVNDVLLVAATGAMADVVGRRGQVVRDLVVSVPVSARVEAGGAWGNQVGVMPVRLTLGGTAAERLVRVSAVTRTQKTQVRGASAALVGPVFRLLGAIGVFRWFVDRQRLVNTFLTNLRGPGSRLCLAGAPILQIAPVTITAGNVGVAFAALSYAGRLTVTVIVDPDVVPELRAVASALESQLAAIAATGQTEPPERGAAVRRPTPSDVPTHR
ncbi:MAG TPA: wax ester/triacylglycerol synthase domain-containing protein [Cellulomonadaceae bacterium]|nr:wax ester/triacylglycerol synthase domain-containing protein [Cellulomonadaceae bacterium]